MIVCKFQPIPWNENIGILHFREKVAMEPVNIDFYPHGGGNCTHLLTEFGEKVRTKLLTLQGVESYWVPKSEPYTIYTNIAPLFEFQEIQEQVKEIFDHP